MLLLGGLLSSFVLILVYERVRPAGAMLARWALALGLAGALGAALHGGYDLANAINPPASNPIALANLPSPIDPQGPAHLRRERAWGLWSSSQAVFGCGSCARGAQNAGSI